MLKNDLLTKLGGAARVVSISVLMSVCLTYTLGPSDKLIYHDIVIKSDEQNFMVGFKQPFWSANQYTVTPVLIDTKSYKTFRPSASQLDEIASKYNYKPNKNVLLRHVFPITLILMVIGLNLTSKRRKHYDTDDNIRNIISKRNELKSNYFDRVRFFWLLPLMNKRLKRAIFRKHSLFNLIQKTYEEQSGNTANHENLFFKIINDALLNNKPVIKMKLKVDENPKVVRRTSSLNNGHVEYAFVSRNYPAVANQFIKQLSTLPSSGPSVSEIVTPPATVDLSIEAEHSFINGLNHLVSLFNLDDLVRFEPSRATVADYVMNVETTISESKIDPEAKSVINHSDHRNGGIFHVGSEAESSIYYLRPRFRFITECGGKTYRWFPMHSYEINSELKLNSDISGQLSDSLLKRDVHLAVGEMLMRMLNLPQTVTMTLTQLDPQLSQTRRREANLCEKLRITMDKSYTANPKAQADISYDLYSSAYVTKILSDNANLIRTEIMFSVLQRFIMTT